MKHFEKLMNVKDTCSYSNQTAIAQYNGNVKVGIDIYLFRTCICKIDLINKSFILDNYGWTTASTTKALREWLVYLQDNGYLLSQINLTGALSDRYSLALRVPAQAKGGNKMELTCTHVGRTNRQIKSIPSDLLYLGSNQTLGLSNQKLGCYMRGRNVADIAQYIKSGDGIKFTLYFQLPEAPELYGIWIHKEELFLFKFRAQKIAYRSDFKALNATYIAIEMYRAKDEKLLNLVRMIGLEDSAYLLFKNYLQDFEQLV